MERLLERLVGKKVTVWSAQGEGGGKDVGTLEAFDDQWIRLRGKDDELFYFSIARVRLIKPLDP